jgi:hypothetical protein
MTSFRQIEANRRNAQSSTGPKTEIGKQRSRGNAVRHGLTAETVIATVEDAEEYQAFEAAIIADYDAQSAVERELVLRLASLLWRLRRATAIESGLFDIEADHLGERRQDREIQPESRQGLYAMIGQAARPRLNQDPISPGIANTAVAPAGVPTPALAHCFLSLATLPSDALDRLSRYEVILWRQVGQTLIALDTLDRRKPNERRRYHTRHLPSAGVEN